MGVLFVPVYISYLGIEAYGLIGLFATLQAWLSLLDLGLSPTLNREMARLHGGAHTAESIRDLLRSVELIYGATAIAIAVVIYLSGGWLASHWLHAEKLSIDTVATALSITGAVIACRWIGGLYRGALGGLQEQVWLNASVVVFSTLRGAGVIAVLAVVSNSINAYFIFQGALAAIEALVLGTLVYRTLPPAKRQGRFQVDALRAIWRFAAGITAITIFSLFLTQMDKVVLPTLLTLSAFGYYILAGAVSGGLGAITTPIASAVGPRFAELVVRNSEVELATAYHRYTQLLILLIAPVCGVISLFSWHLLLLWTRSVETSDAVAPILSLLVIAAGLSGLALIPYMLQLAHGSTRFAAKVNAVAVVALVPLLLVLATRWGGMGAAAALLILNLGYVALAIPLMHRFILVGEFRRWLLGDILPAVVAVLAALLLYRALLPVLPVGRGVRGKRRHRAGGSHICNGSIDRRNASRARARRPPRKADNDAGQAVGAIAADRARPQLARRPDQAASFFVTMKLPIERTSTIPKRSAAIASIG